MRVERLIDRIFYLYTLTSSTEADFRGGGLKVNLKFTGARK